jgi:hypothetical protein
MIIMIVGISLGVQVGGLEHFLFFQSVGNFIIPTDFHSIIFQRGRAQNHQPDYH